MAVIAADTFTVASDVSLYGRTPSTGTGPWAQHATGGTGTITVDAAADRLYASNVDVGIAYLSDSPGSADHSVKATFIRVTSPTLESSVGVVGRVETSALTWYSWFYNSTYSTWYLQKRVAGTFTTLASWAEALVDGDTRAIELRMTGSTIAGYVAGVLQASVTDTAITAQGVAGVLLYDGNPATGTTGYALDNFSLETIAVPAGGVRPQARLMLMGVS